MSTALRPSIPFTVWSCLFALGGAGLSGCVPYCLRIQDLQAGSTCQVRFEEWRETMVLENRSTEVFPTIIGKGPEQKPVLRQRSYATGRIVQEVPLPSDLSRWFVREERSISPDGRTLAYLAEDGKVKLYSLATGETRAVWDLGPLFAEGRVNVNRLLYGSTDHVLISAVYSPGDVTPDRNLTQPQRHELRLIPAAGGSTLIYAGEGALSRSLAVGNGLVVYAAEDHLLGPKSVFVYTLSTGARRRFLQLEAEWRVDGLALDPEGARLAVAMSRNRAGTHEGDDEFRVYELTTGQLLARMAKADGYEGYEFFFLVGFADSSKLVVRLSRPFGFWGTWDSNLFVFRLPDWKPMREFKGIRLANGQISPDGRYLVFEEN